MNPWKQFLDVQRHDTLLDQLEHRRTFTPERAELAALPEQVEAVEADLARQEETRHSLGKDQQRLEDEVVALNERRGLASAKLYDGSVAAPKELSALQEDIGSIDRRIGTLEDQMLENMEQIEPVDAEIARLNEERLRLLELELSLTERIAEVEADIDTEVASVEAERAAAMAGIDPELVEGYERMRAKLGGVAVARLQGGKCEGCHLTLSAVEVDRIKHLPLDEPVTCEECGRFLVR